MNADVADTTLKQVYDNFANIGDQTWIMKKIIFL